MPVSIKVDINSGITLGLPVGTEVPAFCYKQRSANTYGCSLRKLPEVLALFRNISNAEDIHNDLIRTTYEEEMLRRNFDIDAYAADHVDEYGNLWEHQQRGVAIAKAYSRYAFFYDTRTGKTRMAYQIMQNALMAGKTKRCIVFVPSSIIPDWLADAKEFPQLKVNAYYKDAKTKNVALTTPCHILLMSVEQAVAHSEMLYALKFNFCFFDESSKLKSHRSQISKFMLTYSQTVKYMYLLSATPAPNGYHEYYIQMRCIDPYIFPQARTHFVNKYFNNLSRNPNFEKLIIKSELEEEFISLIKDYAIYVDQTVMPTAGKEFIQVTYDLDTKTKKAYNDMCHSLSLSTGGITITVDMAAAMRAKLQQIASGFIIDTDAKKQNDNARFFKLLDEEKTEVYAFNDGCLRRTNEVLKILAQYADTEQFVIWANYHEEFKALENMCIANKLNYAILNGGVSQTNKEAIVDKFKAHQIKCLLCHPLSVGMGKNFTEAHIAIYYSLNDSWEAFKQSSERIAGHIKVQPNKCLYYILIANGTVNAVVYDNLQNKRDQSYGLLEHIRYYGG